MYLKRTALLATLAIGAMAAPPASAVTLSLNPGDNITFNTTNATYSGAANGSGQLVGGIAVFNFDNVNLPSGATVNLTGSNPFSLYSQGDINLGTTLNASGTGQTARLGGGNGGNQKANGQGPGAGTTAGDCCFGGSGGSYGGSGGGNVTILNPAPLFVIGLPGATYGSDDVAVLQGGSGGSGGGDCCGSLNHLGGAGGGAIDLHAEGNINLSSTAQILANGANGGFGNQNRTGGGGSGGGIRISADNINLDAGAVISAAGGASTTNGGVGATRTGGGGGGGRIATFGNLNNAGTIAVAGGFGDNTDVRHSVDVHGQAGTLFAGANAQLNVQTGLKLWLDAADLSTLTTVGNEVTQWQDKSGNANHALAGATKRPEFVQGAVGGQNTLAFDRDQLTVSNLDIAAGQARTLFLVLDYDTLTQNSEVFGTSTATMVDVGTFTQSERIRLRDSSSNANVGGDDGFSGIYSGAGSLPTGTHIVTIVAEAGGGTTIMIDGEIFRDHAGSFFHYGLTGNVGIGGAFFNGREFIGNLSEVLVYDRALSGGDLTQIGLYLEQKYNLDSAFAIPEPASASLLLLASAAMLRRRRAA